MSIFIDLYISAHHDIVADAILSPAVCDIITPPLTSLTNDVNLLYLSPLSALFLRYLNMAS